MIIAIKVAVVITMDMVVAMVTAIKMAVVIAMDIVADMVTITKVADISAKAIDHRVHRGILCVLNKKLMADS